MNATQHDLIDIKARAIMEGRMADEISEEELQILACGDQYWQGQAGDIVRRLIAAYRAKREEVEMMKRDKAEAAKYAYQDRTGLD